MFIQSCVRVNIPQGRTGSSASSAPSRACPSAPVSSRAGPAAAGCTTDAGLPHGTSAIAPSMFESLHGHRTIRSLPDELRSRRDPRQTFRAPDTKDEIAALLHGGGAELHGPGVP